MKALDELNNNEVQILANLVSLIEYELDEMNNASKPLDKARLGKYFSMVKQLLYLQNEEETLEVYKQIAYTVPELMIKRQIDFQLFNFRLFPVSAKDFHFPYEQTKFKVK